MAVAAPQDCGEPPRSGPAGDRAGGRQDRAAQLGVRIRSGFRRAGREHASACRYRRRHGDFRRLGQEGAARRRQYQLLRPAHRQGRAARRHRHEFVPAQPRQSLRRRRFGGLERRAGDVRGQYRQPARIARRGGEPGSGQARCRADVARLLGPGRGLAVAEGQRGYRPREQVAAPARAMDRIADRPGRQRPGPARDQGYGRDRRNGDQLHRCRYLARCDQGQGIGSDRQHRRAPGADRASSISTSSISAPT